MNIIYEDEPDHDIFIVSGFICEIKRHPQMKHLCGYIYVPIDHPWNEKDEYSLNIKVHGGVTFYSKEKEHTIIGFDCAHYGDLVPTKGLFEIQEGTYKDWNYVYKECKKLSEQASSVYNVDLLNILIEENKTKLIVLKALNSLND